MPDRVKPSFVIFDIRALWRSGLSVRVPGLAYLAICPSLITCTVSRDCNKIKLLPPLPKHRAMRRIRDVDEELERFTYLLT